MYENKTLVVVLSMHRSGSSLTTNVLQRLGMSLGPFDLLGATEFNKYGHFEAVPIYELDKELMQLLFGFTEDVPETEDLLQRFCESEGRWLAEEVIPESMYQRGRELIAQLIGSGSISGFKDPRVPLLWPFWNAVFRSFRDVRIVPVFTARTPHEVAMSIFTRSQGLLPYRAALDVAAVHFRRMNEIRSNWGPDHCLVRFDSSSFWHDLRQAADLCGLEWRSDVFLDIYDPKSRHQHPNLVAHHAHTRFQQLVGETAAENVIQDDLLAFLERDAALREKTLRAQIIESRGAAEQFRQQLTQAQEEIRHAADQAKQLEQQLTEVQGQKAEIEQQTLQLDQQLSDSRTQSELLKQRVDLVETQLAQSLEECTRTKQLADQIERQLAQTRAQEEQVSQQAQQLQTDLCGTQEQMTLLRQYSERLESELAQSRQDHNQSQQHAGQLSGQLKSSQRENDSLKQHVQQLESSVAESQVDNKRGKQRLEELEQQLMESHGRASQLEQRLVQAGERNEYLRQRMEQVQSALSLTTGPRTWRLRNRATRLLRRSQNRHLTISNQTTPRPCTVIVPVYNAFDETITCLRSVLKNTNGLYRLLILDDASPQGSLTEYLPQDIVADIHVHVCRNAGNLGFVRTCNRGMRESCPDDVVLLNSDTEVTPGWLEKLRSAAYSSDRVATVTPLTNNGQICSVPEFLKDNDLPPGYTLNEFAELIEQASLREYPKVPTCVGFCVYIKRDAIDQVGYFDEERFGKGYGEENDFSARAQAMGFIDIVDDATFVYHKGQMSFRERTSELTAAHLEVLARKHPSYPRRLRKFLATAPLKKVHGRVHDAMLRRWMKKSEYSVLHVLHNPPLTSPATGQSLPGGTEYHAGDMIRSIPDAAHWSLFSRKGTFWLTAHVPNAPEQRFVFSQTDKELGDLIASPLFDVVHLHQSRGFDWQKLGTALLKHGNYVVSLHDFQTCCPRTLTLTPDQRVCTGQECTTSCGCGLHDVQKLRSTFSEIFHAAKAVVHFSESTKRRVEEILEPDCHWKLIEHGIPFSTTQRATINAADVFVKPSASRPLKVAFLGVSSPHKGQGLLRRLLKQRVLPSGIPVEWHVIGLTTRRLPSGRNVVNHGRYNREDIPAILQDVSPDLIAILSIWPETYCLALDEALSCGIPVLSSDLGGPAERIRRHRCGWVLNELRPDTVLTKLQEIVDRWDDYSVVRQRVRELSLPDISWEGRQYGQLYKEACRSRLVADDDTRQRALESLPAKHDGRSSLLRTLAIHAVLGGESFLQALGFHSAALSVFRHLLPRKMQHLIRDLRSTPPTMEQTQPPVSFTNHSKAA